MVQINRPAGRFNRRSLLKAGVASAALVGLPGLLAACGGEDDDGSVTPTPASSGVGPTATTPPVAATATATTSAPTNTPAAAQPTPTTAPAPVERGTLRTAHTLEWAGKETLDPAHPNRFFPTIALLYNRLVRHDSEGLPMPDLAESWEANETATRWTFNLRPGVHFHDGKPLVSSDVVYTIRHVVDPELGSPGASVLEIIDTEAFETPDDLTVTFTLKQAHADFPMLLMHYSCYVIAEGTADTVGKTGNGTGPYKLDTFESEGLTALVSNDDYWNGPPGLAAIKIVGISDDAGRANALMAGQIDYVEDVSAASAELLATNKALVVDEVPTGNWLPLVMRTDTEPFTDPKVRLAMKLVVDREALLQTVLQGHGSIGVDHPVWPGDPYRLDVERPQDIARAKALLAEAGYPNGLNVTLFTSDIMNSMIAIAVAYKEMAALAGINVEIKQTPADGYWNDVWLVEPFCVSSWGQRPADQVLNEVFRCGAAWNETFWCNQEFVDSLDDARTELDFEARLDLYHQAQRILMDDGGAIIALFNNEFRAMNTKVRGIPPGQNYFDFALVTIES